MADVITRLKLESGEYDSKIKRATQGLLQMEQECRKVGGTLAVLEKDQLEYVKGLGKMETVSQSARGRVSELTQSFTELSIQYKRLTDEEKKGDYGKALNSSLGQLKDRINDAKMQLKEVDVALGNGAMKGGDFSSILGQLGQKLGINSDLMGLVTTGTLGYTAAITAATTATIAATKAWADYNSELSKQTNAAMVTTGLKGDDLNKLVDSAKAVSDIYGVDFREVVSSANTLMTQFGKTGDEAMQLIRDGMQGMIEGDGGKLLSMIQQYAPAFQSAGVSASQLVAVIQNSEGGIFSEQNMSAIIMALPKIKMMSENTSKALAGIGIDGNKMAAEVESGAISVFDALQQISQAIDDNKDKTRETSVVMQEMFGRQARTAGDNLGKAIATLNTNLEETKKQTGAVGESLANVEMATERLNKSLRDTFGYDGWEQMANGIKGAFVGALAEAITATNDLRNAIFEVSGIDVFSVMISGAADALGPLGQILDRLRQIAGIGQLIKDGGISGATSGVGAGVGSLIGGNSGDNNTSVTETESEKALKAEIERLKKALADAKKPKGGETTLKQEVKLPDGSVAALEKQLSDLQKAQKLATDTKGWKEYDAQINVVKEKIAALKGELPKDKVATFRIDAITDDARKALESIEGVHIEEKKVEVTADTQQAEKAIQAIPKQKDVQVDVLPGDVNLPNIPTDDKTIKVNVEEGDVTLPDISTGKTVEVTVIADTQEAYDQIKELYPDAPIELKVKVKADTTDLTKLTNTNIGSKISELQKQVNTSEWQSEDYAKAKTNLADANAFKNVFEKAVKTGIDTADIDQSALWQKIAGSVDIDDAVWQELIDRINEKLAESDIVPIKIDFETGGIENVSKSVKDLNKSSQVTAQVVGSIGRAFNEIEDPAAKVAGTIAEAIAQVALGYGQALAQSSSLGPWGWIAFAATGMATMISSINAIKSNTKGFATGGIVPGNSFNDQLRTSDYGISSGELILNKAQQGNLASQLTGAERGTQSGTPYVDGEKIYLGINNFLKRSGRGEIVTSR